MLFHPAACSFNGVPIVSFGTVTPINTPMAPPLTTPPGQGPMTFYPDASVPWQTAVPLSKVASPTPLSRSPAASTPPSLTGSSPSVQHSSPNSQLGFRGPGSIIIASGNGGNVAQFHPSHQQQVSLGGANGIDGTNNMSPLPPGAMPACAWNLSLSPQPAGSQPIYVMLPPGSSSSGANMAPGRVPSSVGAALPPRRGNGMMYELGEWYEGVVKRYNPMRGFGFLTATHHVQVVTPNARNTSTSAGEDDGQNSQRPTTPPQPTLVRTPVTVGDVFVHQSYIRMQGFRVLSTGDRVAFRVGKLPGKDANQAVSVQMLSTTRSAAGAAAANEDEDPQGSSSTTATTVFSGVSATIRPRDEGDEGHDSDQLLEGPDVREDSLSHSDTTVGRILARIAGRADVTTAAASPTGSPNSRSASSDFEGRGEVGGAGTIPDAWVAAAAAQRRGFHFSAALNDVAAALETTDFTGEADLASPPAQWGLSSPSAETRGLFGGFDGK